MRMALSGESLTDISQQLIARAQNDENDANALMDLSIIMQFNQRPDLALRMQQDALQIQQVYHMAASRAEKLKLLVIMAAGELIGNTPVECLLEDSDIAFDLLYISDELPLPRVLPEHDIVFVAIAESVMNKAILDSLCQVHWSRPVINRPEMIARLSRDNAYHLLHGVAKTLVPQTLRMERGELERRCSELGQQPVAALVGRDAGAIIIRPQDSHAGRALEKFDDVQSLADYLERTQGNVFYVSYFVDFRSADGQYKKYRIELIEGRPYLCHMAISDHWIIHYLNAGMDISQEKRDEEAAMMASFDQEFAVRHAAALHEIYERAGLEYLGIDCAEVPGGELLIFEIDSNMVVHDMDPVDIYPYKQPQMRRIFSAFQEMLRNKAAGRKPA